MYSENPSPQFTLVTIYLQIPFFRNPRQLRGLYIGLDYNRNPVARRILLIKKSDCTDTDEFLSMESGLIQKEDFTSEQQAYYDLPVRPATTSRCARFLRFRWMRVILSKKRQCYCYSYFWLDPKVTKKSRPNLLRYSGQATA